MDAVLSGKFMSDFEGYALDQFPLRDEWRTLKALNQLYVYRQKDNNGVYIKDGYAAKLEYPMNESSIDHAAERFRYCRSSAKCLQSFFVIIITVWLL